MGSTLSQVLSPNATSPTTGLFLVTDPKAIRQIPENFTNISIYSRNCVIVYVILFFVGASCNLSIFFTVGKQLWQKKGIALQTRIKLLIWNLACADLLVCFVVIPIEVVWRLTVQWHGGEFLCKLAQFFRSFGLYSSSMVIVCISLDRFLAIVYPLSVIGGTSKRVHHMLIIAWTSALLFSMPQLLMSGVHGTVLYPTFKQCTSFGYFSSLNTEIVYNLLSLGAMYFIPLVIIILTSGMVLYTMVKKASRPDPNSGLLKCDRRPNARARNRTLVFSMIVVSTFVICWTPYITMIMWYLFDYETAEKLVDPRIQEALFITAVSNSCINPIIYGNYMKMYWRNLTRCCKGLVAASQMLASFSSSLRLHPNHQHTKLILLQFYDESQSEINAGPLLRSPFEQIFSEVQIRNENKYFSIPSQLHNEPKELISIISGNALQSIFEPCYKRSSDIYETTV